ncbi:MAG: serpin family protein [Paludibacteraceae bacterium]|nr:serpin family protein [Paludibacteraceae bacterium]
MRKTIFMLAVAAFCCACNVSVNNPDEKSYENHDWGDGNGNDVAVELRLSPQQEQILLQSNKFSLSLLRQVYENETSKENVIISPLSASMALSMLMNGADGETLSQMKEVLGLGEWTNEDVNEYNRLMLNALPRLDTCTQMTLANSLWLQTGFPVMENFVSNNKLYFNAEVENVEFADPKTADLINKWAADHTHDLIKEVVNENMIRNCVTLLANALYFKGVWADKFEKEETKDEDFMSGKGVKQVVDMMHKQAEMKYRYLSDKKAQLLELDYLGGAYCMDILLPAEGLDIPTMLASIDAEEMPKWEDKYWPEREVWTYNQETGEEKTAIRRNLNEVKVQMPKFTLRYSRELNKDLMALGMTDMFDDFKADFTRLSTIPTYVSLVKQDTYMSVDEAGTEAAAVTVIVAEATSIVVPKIPEMYMNRPFVLFIREKKYGTILFAAVIGNPNEK